MEEFNKQWYQMDLFDLDDRSYTPKKIGFEHYASGCYYKCPKCNAIVGTVSDGEWFMKRDVCKNGHKIQWEE